METPRREPTDLPVFTWSPTDLAKLTGGCTVVVHWCDAEPSRVTVHHVDAADDRIVIGDAYVSRALSAMLTIMDPESVQ